MPTSSRSASRVSSASAPTRSSASRRSPHLNVWLAVPLAALTTLIVAVPVMVVIFRLRTAYLAVGTWVAAEVLMLIAGKLPGFGGGSGTSLPIPVVKQFGARLGDRIDIFYAMSLGARADRLCRDLGTAALAGRPRPHRDARQRGSGGRGGRRPHPRRAFSASSGPRRFSASPA